MVRAELVERIAKQLDTTLENSEKILAVVLSGFIQGLKSDGDVIIRGFGRFVVQDKKERMGRNPKNGEPAVIKARKKVSFKSSKNLKAVLN
jgi:DNA-binding protein HU-beta